MQDEFIIQLVKNKGHYFQWKTYRLSIVDQIFLACSKLDGYKNFLQGIYTALGYEEGLAVISNKIDKLRELNEDAYKVLLLSITEDTEVGRVVFQIIHRSKTEKLSDGESRISWKILANKFGSNTDPFQLILKKKFTNYWLTSSKVDPEIWVTVLEYLALK